MLSPVEQALQTLLPTTHTIPTQVSSLASSLLAQSKHAAPSLKADEEIARTYTCCHIACERLANKLTLDLGKLNPPCGPRVYKKLHAYFDGVLTAGTASQPATPKTNRTVDAMQGKTPVPAYKTPVKSRLEGVKTPVNTSTASAKRKRQDDEQCIVPSDLAMLSQHVCKDMHFPECVPHIYAGLESLLPVLRRPAEHDPVTKRRRSAKHVPAFADISLTTEGMPILVLSLLSHAYAVMKGEQLDVEDFQRLSDVSTAFLNNSDSSRGDVPLQASINALSEQLQELPAFQAWHGNLPQLEEQIARSANPAKTPIRPLLKRGAADDVPGAAGLLPGLGTMFQPAYDWLSDERQAEYTAWSKDIMQRIASMEKT